MALPTTMHTSPTGLGCVGRIFWLRRNSYPGKSGATGPLKALSITVNPVSYRPPLLHRTLPVMQDVAARRPQTLASPSAFSPLRT